MITNAENHYWFSVFFYVNDFALDILGITVYDEIITVDGKATFEEVTNYDGTEKHTRAIKKTETAF